MTDQATMTQLAKDVAELSPLFNGEDAPFSCVVHAGDPRLLVVAGPNASGKSVFVQILAGWGRKAPYNWSPVTVSIRERTGAGLSEMAGMRRTFMFGDESEQSTGATSVGVALSGFKNIWTEGANKPRLLVLDEPDMGLSEDYAFAMGQLIAAETEAAFPADKPCSGVVVVTHSRTLVEGIRAWGVNPGFVSMESTMTLDEWLTNRQHRTLEDLKNLSNLGHERQRQVRALIKARNK